MPIAITGKNIEVGNSLKDSITNDLRNIVSRYMGDIIEARVILSKEHDTKEHLVFRTDLYVHISHNFEVHSQGYHEDAYRSAGLAMDKLETRIKKYKSRLQNRKRRPEIDNHIPMQRYVIQPSEEDTGEDNHLIIAESPGAISDLSVGEAVMRMDITDTPVVMFRNAANGEINIVYRRPDGHVGWIDPNSKLA